jgi:hypothetical protein
MILLIYAQLEKLSSYASRHFLRKDHVLNQATLIMYLIFLFFLFLSSAFMLLLLLASRSQIAAFPSPHTLCDYA